MDIRQVAYLILTGEVKKVNENSRIEIIRLVLSARKRVVTYEPGKTICPVCDHFGLAGDVIVVSSPGTTRHCECRRCTATFTAEGPTRLEYSRPCITPIETLGSLEVQEINCNKKSIVKHTKSKTKSKSRNKKR